ncbi:MAG: hypothetical protein ABFD25_03390 [Clostridiaceae bacterium]
MSVSRCWLCDHCKGYYRYKTDTTGHGRLVSYYCEHPIMEGKAGHESFIAMSSVSVEDKIKTSPRWCPMRQKGALRQLQNEFDTERTNHKTSVENLTSDYIKALDQISRLQEQLDKTFIIANNAIYFNDSSDYLSALYDVCRALKPSIEDESIGSKYISESLLKGE